MQGSYLNLVIRANSVELHDSGTTHDSVVNSVKIHKGDVETALKECYIFINENRNLRTDINFSIPSEQIKFFIKHIDRKEDKDNVNLIAEHFLKNEKNIDISSILYNIVRTGDLIEISVIDREKLLEAITFIENIGFKVVSAIGNLSDQKRSFVFDTKLEFKGQPKFGVVAPPKIILAGIKFVTSIASKINSNNSWNNFLAVRSFSIFGIALIATVAFAVSYFDRSSKKVTLVKSDLKIENVVITEKEVITPLKTFLLYQKINFLPNQDKSDIELARRPDEPRSKILPAKLNNKSLGNKSIHWQSADLIYADQSEIKIKNPDLQIVGRSDTNFLKGNSQEKLFISNNKARHTNDPLVNFSINSGLALNNEATYSRPNLNLRSPINEIKTKKWSKEEFASPTDVSLKNSERIQKAPSGLSIATGDLEKKKFDRLMANFQISLQDKPPTRPRIRPNKYPFEIKKIPKEYARPRVRPDFIEELAAKSQIFSYSQIGQSIKPKVRPKFRKRIVVSDYSEEGDEASVTGTISSAATKKSIVKLATKKNAINKRKLNVLSIYLRGSEKRAIVLFPTGQTKLVKVGDRLDGGRVAAIGTTEIRYIKGGNNLVLKIPQG
ncbi:hypothetical protein OAZ20_00500 [Paracoccaceae bacterium]|nr:hypothetical protein [Paracoccaceae bacterium]